MNSRKTLQPIKILIVEDFHVETGVIERELTDAEFNYDSKVVCTEDEYIKALHAFSPDVILSPYSLATTNAVKLLSIARSEGFEVPFILLAFDLSEDIAIDLLAEGIEDYVQRSTLKRLPVAIRKALQRYKIQLELLLSEVKLRESEASLREAQKLAKVGSWEWDIKKKKFVCSDETFRIYGIKKRDLSIAEAQSFIHSKDKERIAELMSTKITGGLLPTVEYTIVAGDGKTKEVRANAQEIRNAEGYIIKVIGTLQDITERKKIELELIKSQSLLSLGEEISHSGSFELDLVNSKTTWSPNFYRITGIKHGSVINNEFFVSHVHPEDKDAYKNALAANIRSGVGQPFVYRIIRPDNGQIVHLLANGRRVEEDGKTRWIGGVLDITERVLAQDELENKTIQRDLILSTAKIGVWHWSVGSDKLVWDESCAQLFDQFSTEIDTEKFYFLIHPEDRDYVREQLIKGLKTGEYSAEYRLTRNDSTTFVLSRGRAVIGKNGKATRIDGIIIDITDRKRDQEQIKMLSLVASETNSGVLIHDAQGRITWSNRGFTSITGYSLEEALGKEPWTFLSGPDTNMELIETTYAMLRAGKSFTSENVLLNKNGQAVWVSTAFSPIMDEKGNLKKVVSVGVDITDQKQKEFSQKTMLEELEKANSELKKRSSS